MDRPEPTYTRRSAAWLIGASAAALVPALRSRGAGAQIAWCRRDPIFSLDRKVGHVYVSVPDHLRQLNDSSTDVVIYHPRKCATKLIFVDPVGFGTGEGISAIFKEAEAA